MRGVTSNSNSSRASTRPAFAASSPSPSPSSLSSVDAHVDSGSDDDGGSEYSDGDQDDDDQLEDEDDADCVPDDVDQVDASGRVLNDGGELLDEPALEEKQQAHGVAPSSSSTNLDGSRRFWLCPSKYGRPATVFFDYPHEFGMRRPQARIPCDKPCVLRFKHADSACIYNSVTGTLKRAGFIEQEGSSKKDLAQFNVRFGKHMMPDAFKELKSYQKVNHFPGTGGIGRKDRLARNIAKSRRLHGGLEYNFLPETYLLPADRSLWEMKFNNEPPGTLWISKPNSSSCGRGIKMVSKIADIPVKRACIVSRYIHNPMLVNERKFDLRIYVLVTSFHPLKIYLYNNGLARFCTEKYDCSKKNLKKKYIHLTNFSVNKKSKNFVKNNNDQNLATGDDGGDSSKWSLLAFKKYLLSLHGPARCAEVWASVSDIFIKTLLSVETNVSSNIARLGSHRDQCYELYGFDILLDANLRAHLIEVNCAPSLSSSSPLDRRIKNELLTDVFHTVGVKPAYIKDKEKDNKKAAANAATSRQKSSTSERPASSSRADSNVVRGGTMGPSNSRSSRAVTSILSPTGSASSTTSSSFGASSESASTGGRVGKIKSTPQHIFFSNLNKSDLTLLREFRDEIDRAESGAWRLIFPVGGPTPSTDAYAHLFEVEKYEDLLLMRFQTLPEATKESICQGKSVEPHEMAYADGKTPSASRRASTAGAFNVSGSINSNAKAARPSSVALTGTNLSQQPQVIVQASPYGLAAAASSSPSPSPSSAFSASSSSPSPGGGVVSTHGGSTMSEQEMNRRMLLNANLTGAQRPSPVQRFLADPKPHAHAIPTGSPRAPAGVSGLGLEHLQVLSLSDHEDAAQPSSPLDASPHDNQADEFGRPVRRYFYEQGVALQPYLPHAPQYHDGWNVDEEPAHTSQNERSPAASIGRSPHRASRPGSAARTRSTVGEHPSIPSAPSAIASAISSPHVRARSTTGTRKSTGMIGLEGPRAAADPLQQQAYSRVPPAYQFSRPLSSTLARYSQPGHAKHPGSRLVDEQPVVTQQQFGFAGSPPLRSGRVMLQQQQQHHRVSQPGAFTPTTGSIRSAVGAAAFPQAYFSSSTHPVADYQQAARRPPVQKGASPAFGRLTGW